MTKQKAFQFKEFSLNDDRCGMKIGVDAILLGALSHHPAPKRILDIGTGCGIVALMLAQRYPHAHINAIEIEPEAVEQAKDNVNQSPFRNVTIYQDNFLANSSNPWTKEQYDLIVSNPPYFEENKIDENLLINSARMLARSSAALPLHLLVKKSCELLSPSGKTSIIYPNNELLLTEIKYLKEKKFFTKSIRIQGQVNKEAKRLLLSFSKQQLNSNDEFFVIEEQRGTFTEQYKKATKNFHPFL